MFVSENGRMELYKYTCFSQLDRPREKAEQNQAVNMWSLALTSHLAHQVRARVAEVCGAAPVQKAVCVAVYEYSTEPELIICVGRENV